MNNKQIRSAAKACLNRTDCNHCPYNDEGCVRALVSNLITLSEKQESETERLKKEVEFYKKDEIKSIKDIIKEIKNYTENFFEWDEEQFIPNFNRFVDILMKEYI